ncbi:hypothetical protein STSO111631_08440 [Stackebrandtia soli]
MPPQRAEPVATQWNLEREAPVSGGDMSYMDPELAAAAGMDAGRPGGEIPGRQSLSQHGAPRHAPQHQPQTLMDEPTQLHNPVAPVSSPHMAPVSSPHMAPVSSPHMAPASSHPSDPSRYQSDQGKNRRGYPEQVSDGVYRRSRPGLGALVAIVAIGLAVLIGYMLMQQIAEEGPVSPSAVLAGGFALAGLPLTAWGIAPLLGTGSNSGPEDFSAVLRAPYVYLVTGLVLLLAAGMAAA